MMKTLFRNFIELHRGYDLPKNKRISGDFPIVSSTGIVGKHNSYKVKGPGVITGRSGTIGKVIFEKGCFWPLNTTLFVSDFKGNDPKYVYYWLQCFDLKHYTTGSTVPTLNRNDLSNLIIDVPTINEQRKRREILEILDAKIATNIEISQQLESMAKTIYDYWFLQFEFPDKDGKPYKSNGGKMIWNDQLKQEIPGGWEVKELQDLAKLGNGINYNKNIKGNEKCKIVNVRDITSSSLLINSHKLTHLSLPKKSMEKYIIKKTDILIARSGTPGAVRILPSTTEKVIFAGFIIHCLPKDSELRWYLTFMLKKFEGTNVTTTGGSILKNVSQNSLKSISIILPSSVVLKRFNKQIIPIIEQLENILEENQQLKSLRNFLLPMLMNGQVSISD